ncbi:MAG: hypothetical protein HRU19_12515 [Pseudobacteriovorax sp.]|nr:hypothetical protein [Pseudobacteriovorax sp.]
MSLCLGFQDDTDINAKAPDGGGFIDREFISNLLDCQRLLTSFSIQKSAYSSGAIQHFQNLPTPVKRGRLERLRRFRQTLLAMRDLGPTAMSNIQSLFISTQELRLTFNYKQIAPWVSDDSCLEVFDLHGNSLWRNFNSFKACSYDLSQVFAYSWDECYRRSYEIECLIRENIFATTAIKQPVLPMIPRHVVQEAFSRRGYTLGVEYTCLLPVMNHKAETSGYLVASSVDLLSESKHYLM